MLSAASSRLQLLDQLSTKTRGDIRFRLLAGQGVRIFNGSSQCGKKSITGRTSGHVPFQFLAE